MYPLPAGWAALWLCKVSGVHSVQGYCHPHFQSWSSVPQTYLPVLWSRPLFCLYKKIKNIKLITICSPHSQWLFLCINMRKQAWLMTNTAAEKTKLSSLTLVIIPVVWNWVLGRCPCQATHARCTWGLWVGIVGRGTQLAPGLGIKTGQEGRFGWLSTGRALGCNETTRCIRRVIKGLRMPSHFVTTHQVMD